METKLAGYCGVDSGQIMVIDPCYAFQGGTNYEAICKVSLADTFGEFPLPANGYNQDIGVVTSSGYGDGKYPVYVNLNNEGRVTSLSIIFVPDDDDFIDDEDEDYA
jgi:hypothetical protein